MEHNSENLETGFELNKETVGIGRFVVLNEVSIMGTHQEGGKLSAFSFHKDQVITIVHADEIGVVVSAPGFTLNVLLGWKELEESHLNVREQR